MGVCTRNFPKNTSNCQEFEIAIEYGTIFYGTSINKLTLKNYIWQMAICGKNEISYPFMFQKETKMSILNIINYVVYYIVLLYHDLFKIKVSHETEIDYRKLEWYQ